MTEKLDIAVWGHFWNDYYPRVIGSVGRYVMDSYNLIVVCEPGTCHDNMARALDRRRIDTRFFCFMDWDVELLDIYTIPRLIELVSRPDVGVAVPDQISHTSPAMEEYREKMEKSHPAPPRLVTRDWMPAYCMMLDLDKLIPDIDLNIPWRKGMTDVDIGYQYFDAGFKSVRDLSVAVKHEIKANSPPEDFIKYDCPTLAQNEANFPAQLVYMRKKWGKGPFGSD
jgi:hypothetical protein